MNGGFIYIMGNRGKTTFCIGVTSDLKARISDHKNEIGSGFTKKYNLTELLYFEEFQDIYRQLIEKNN